MATLEQNSERKENPELSKSKQLNQQMNDGDGGGGKPGSYEEIQRRLKDALEKNVQWQAYNVERENYVTRLLLQFNQMSADLNKAKMKLDQVARDPVHLQTEQRRHFDELLIEARQQINKKDSEIIRLKDEIGCMKKGYNKEIDEYAQMIDHWRSKCNKHKLAEHQQKKKKNTDEKECVLSLKDLHTQMKLYFDDLREENDKQRNLESENEILVAKVAKLERKLENAKKINKKQMKLIEEGKANDDDVMQVMSPRREKPPLPKEGGSKKEKKIEVKFQMFDDHLVEDGRRLSWQPDADVGDNKTSHRRHQSYEPSSTSSSDGGMLLCPGCNAQYPYSDHQLLIKHIDVCVK